HRQGRQGAGVGGRGPAFRIRRRWTESAHLVAGAAQMPWADISGLRQERCGATAQGGGHDLKTRAGSDSRAAAPHPSPLPASGERGSGPRSGRRVPRIDQLDANVGKIMDITGGKRNVAADGYAGDLHIGCPTRFTATAAVSEPHRGSKRGTTI